MRTKDTLLHLTNEIRILLQYLYLDEKHNIKYNDKSIGLNESLEFVDINKNELININFEDLKSIIRILKIQSPIDYPTSFTNRWEEIKTITNINVSLNMK